MKNTIFAAAIVLALSLTSAAAAKKPPYLVPPATGGDGAWHVPPAGIPPALCNPCIFYSGDLNPDDGQAEGFGDENTLLTPSSSTYAEFTVNPGGTAKVTGILVNVIGDANFDPQNATYDIRTGVSSGDGGTSVTSGTANITVAATGRVFAGYSEFTVYVALPATQTLSAGQYWFNVTPQCTNGAVDGSCYAGSIYLSNSTQLTNNVAGHNQVPYQNYINSSFFSYNWENWCDLGLTNGQCRFSSWGLTGAVQNHQKPIRY
jgi:hypothetical protein